MAHLGIPNMSIQLCNFCPFPSDHGQLGVCQNLISIEESEDAEEGVAHNETYLSFRIAMYEKAKVLDRFIDHQQDFFSAQDDEWGTIWGPLSSSNELLILAGCSGKQIAFTA
ncbi:hypothetical protein BDW74DRAFT_154313 [Aspergillus multicolor]|uniref:uncharacterized protein n=1 Tax=Aspergillus multicolor TaxID=41759 RepID=UPI003CCDA441